MAKTSASEKPLVKLRDDGFYSIPSLTTDNVEACIDSINRDGVRQLYLSHLALVKNPNSEGTKHQELLSQLYQQCPELTAIKMHACALAPVEFDFLLQTLSKLDFVFLESCRFIPDPASDADSRKQNALPSTGVTRLSISSVRGLDNYMLARWLAAMPKLQSLNLGLDYAEPIPGNVLPENVFRNLTEFSASYNSQRLVASVLANAKQLKLLRLHSVDETGIDWEISNDAISNVTRSNRLPQIRRRPFVRSIAEAFSTA